MTRLLLAFLAGCTCGPSGDPAPHGPDADTTAAAAASTCKLFEGARIPCEVVGSTAKPEGKSEIKVSSHLDTLTDKFSTVTMAGTITLTIGSDTFTTPLRGFGMAKAEAVERAVHEWAVVSGSAIVEHVVGDDKCPVVGALEKQPVAPLVVEGGRTVLRGWTRTVGSAGGKLKHVKLAGLVEPAPGLHTVTVSVMKELSEPVFTCTVDGVVSEEACTAAKSYPWEGEGQWGIKQTYFYR